MSQKHLKLWFNSVLGVLIESAFFVILDLILDNFSPIFASTSVLQATYDSSLLALCRLSFIWLECSGSGTYWVKAMSSYWTQKVPPQKCYNPSEDWQHLEEGTLKHACSASVCMTCQHFNYCRDRHYRTIIACPLHPSLITHGDHLISRCLLWMRQRVKEIGWCPEVAWNFE